MPQQIVISGVGGQGVLFITRIIAEAAITKGLAVLASETHGMAQRGGSVISHIKIGPFSSPLIRPGQADLLLALKDENIDALVDYLHPTGRVMINGNTAPRAESKPMCDVVDAVALAHGAGNPRAINLVMLGYAAARLTKAQQETDAIWAIDHVEKVLKSVLSQKSDLIPASLSALKAGFKGTHGS